MSTYDIRSQIAVARLLPDLLAAGARADLDAPVWVIGFDGVTAKVDDKEAFDGWTKVIGATATEPRVYPSGTHLTSSRRYPKERIIVVVRATIPPEA
jgi:hypothetical protein